MAFVIDSTDAVNMLIERLSAVEESVYATSIKIDDIKAAGIKCTCRMSQMEFHENGSIKQILFNMPSNWCNPCKNTI
jgi:hypothetical protein